MHGKLQLLPSALDHLQSHYLGLISYDPLILKDTDFIFNSEISFIIVITIKLFLLFFFKFKSQIVSRGRFYSPKGKIQGKNIFFLPERYSSSASCYSTDFFSRFFHSEFMLPHVVKSPTDAYQAGAQFYFYFFRESKKL